MQTPRELLEESSHFPDRIEPSIAMKQPNEPLDIFTGIFELVLAVGLFFTQTRVSAGWLLVILFVIFLPVNISAALKHVDYQKGNFEGAGPAYLWFRVPLQLLFITWTYLSAIKW